MTKKKKKKVIEPKFSRGIEIPPSLLKARRLRNSLISRVKTQEEKDNTPQIKQLEKLFNHDHFICFYCLNELLLVDTTVDHKTPLSRNGTNDLTNLCISCSDCNSLKGELSEGEYRSLTELLKTFEDDGKYLLTRLRRSSTIFGR